jgi:hypothetical protein
MVSKPKMLHDGLLTPRTREERFAMAEQIERGETPAPATLTAPQVTEIVPTAPPQHQVEPAAQGEGDATASGPALTPDQIRGMYRKKVPTRAFSMRIREPLYDDLNFISRTTGITMTEIAEAAIEQEVAKLLEKLGLVGKG